MGLSAHAQQALRNALQGAAADEIIVLLGKLEYAIIDAAPVNVIAPSFEPEPVVEPAPEPVVEAPAVVEPEPGPDTDGDQEPEAAVAPVI